MNIRFVFVLFCIIAESTQAQNFIGPQEDIDIIVENAKAFSEYVVAADYKAIGNSYTADGKIFPNNQDIIESRDSIIPYWILPKGVKISSHKVVASEIKIIDDHAYDYGRYYGSTLTEDGKEVSWKGKYVIVWRKEDGDWKIYLDICINIKD